MQGKCNTSILSRFIKTKNVLEKLLRRSSGGIRFVRCAEHSDATWKRRQQQDHSRPRLRTCTHFFSFLVCSFHSRFNVILRMLQDDHHILTCKEGSNPSSTADLPVEMIFSKGRTYYLDQIYGLEPIEIWLALFVSWVFTLISILFPNTESNCKVEV